MKRGGGRRYYRPDDVDLLRGVRHLLYGEGYTIRGVQRILREQGAALCKMSGAREPNRHRRHWRKTGPGRRSATTLLQRARAELVRHRIASRW